MPASASLCACSHTVALFHHFSCCCCCFLLTCLSVCSGEEQEEGDDQGEGRADRGDDGCTIAREGSNGKCLAPVAVNSHLHCHASNLSLNSPTESTNPVAESQRKTQKFVKSLWIQILWYRFFLEHAYSQWFPFSGLYCSSCERWFRQRETMSGH